MKALRYLNRLIIFIFFAYSYATFSFAAGENTSILINKAKQQGTVPVLVNLNTSFKAEGLLNNSNRLIQRNRIANMQKRVHDNLKRGYFRLKRNFKYSPLIAMDADEQTILELQASSEVLSIEEDVPVPPALASSNPVIGSPNAWAWGYTGSGQTIAILDTGVDKSHPYFSTLGTKVVSEACYSSNTSSSLSVCPGGVEATTVVESGSDCVVMASGYPSAQQDCGHGTHVAGIAAGNDGSGPNYGVAKEADIIAIQVFSLFPTYCGNSGCMLSYLSDQIQGLERVYELRNSYNIASVNMSLNGADRYTGTCDSTSMKPVIDNLRAVGIATVVSSGNNGYTDSMTFPACISTTISVGATTDSDVIASFSNVSSQLDLFAPGVSITSSTLGNTTTSMSGTSMAAPHVAGAWAVLKQARPQMSVTDILNQLVTTGTLVSDTRSGGSVNNIPRINVDDGLPVGNTLSFIQSEYSIIEQDGNALIGVERAGNNGAVSVDYFSQPVSAHVPSDYVDVSGSIFWNDGESGAKFIIVPIKEDSEQEPAESLQIHISRPVNANIIGVNPAMLMIEDNDMAMAPTAPDIQTAVNNGDGSATVSWVDNSNNETAFTVQREKQHKKKGWIKSSIVASTGENETSITDPGGKGIFRYQVRASNLSGNSLWSSWIEVTVTKKGGGQKPCKGRKCQ